MQKEISLSSSDHLQLLFDYKIKREGGSANTSQLLIELASLISADELKQHLLSNTYVKQLVNTSLVRPFFGKERYRFEENNELLFTEVIADKIVYSTVFGNDFFGSSPVKITLIQLPKSSAVLFQVNHIFIDNNGVKNILRSFNGEKFQFHRTLKPEKDSFFTRLKNGFAFARIMMKKWREPISYISSTDTNPVLKEYIIHDFTAEETNQIESKIIRSHHIKSMSSLLLAVCCKTIQEHIDSKGETQQKYLFQQPSELTHKKDPKYILGNRFSFMYYRLKPEQVTSISEIQQELNKQTMEQMKADIASKSLDLQSILRFLKLGIYYWMMNRPAKGKMTSFAYTYIGETKIIDEFAGRKITNITNIPPVMKNPPVTFGGVLYEGKLRVKICYDSNSMTSKEAADMIGSLKNYLLYAE